MSGHTEHAFETAIEVGLLVSGGYQKRQPADYDETLALFPADVIGFLKDSQPSRWQQLETLLGVRTPGDRAGGTDQGARDQGRAARVAPWLQVLWQDAAPGVLPP